MTETNADRRARAPPVFSCPRDLVCPAPRPIAGRRAGQPAHQSDGGDGASVPHSLDRSESCDSAFDFYIYNCQNPENAYCVYYSVGSNVPMLLTKAQMTNTLAMLIPMLDAIHNFDAAAFAKFFKGMKAAIVAHFADAGSSANKTVLISDLRAKIEGSAETKAMIRPAGKNAVLVDIDADGPADFAFLCSDVKGNMLDTIAIDLTGEGLFNLYLYNCLNPDGAELVLYPADSEAPEKVIKEGELYEKTMAVAAKAVEALYNFDAAAFGETFRGLKKQMIAFSEKK